MAQERGAYDDAEDALGWVKRLEHPSSPWPLMAMGELLEDTGRLDNARYAYAEALQRAPDLGPAHLALARIALTRDELNTAIHHLEIAADEQGMSDAYDIWVRLQLRESDPEAAATLMRWVYRVQEPRSLAHIQAQTAAEVGCHALPAIDTLWQRWPDDPPISRAATRLHQRCASP